MRRGLVHALATVGGLGDRLPAPGTTVGSVAGILLVALVNRIPGVDPRLPAVAGLLLLVPLAVWACGAEAAHRALEDPGAVVLDEVAGQWTAATVLLLARPGVLSAGALVGSFLLFRLFDVLKPWPVRRLERLPGGVGITADDLAAGVLAGLVHLAAFAGLARLG